MEESMTRTNASNRPSARAASATGSEADPTEQALSPIPPRPEARPDADDWSDPSKLRQMSAIWPLLWLTIPLVLLVLYGLLTIR